MTREEAIEILNCYDMNFYDLYGSRIPAGKVAEAFDMAIEALKERPTGKWVGAREFCQHLEEITGEKYQATGIENMIYCNQCWQASRRRSKYCPNCGCRLKGGRK